MATTSYDNIIGLGTLIAKNAIELLIYRLFSDVHYESMIAKYLCINKNLITELKWKYKQQWVWCYLNFDLHNRCNS